MKALVLDRYGSKVALRAGEVADPEVGEDDVLVEADGQSRRMSEGELIGALLRKHPAGDKVNVTVLRGTERVSLVLPMQ